MNEDQTDVATTNVERKRLVELAAQIRDWQTSRRISDAELCRKYQGLGSTKTFKRILDGSLEELDLDRWLMEYQQVWTVLCVEAPVEADPVYDDLWHVRAARSAVRSAMQEVGNNRLVIVEGPSGSGKTTAARCIASSFGKKVVICEATETWKGPKLSPMLGGVLWYLGVREIPNSEEGRLNKVLEVLQQAPVCLVIDEAHHLGLRTLNVIKTILNQTKCQIVLCAVETLFRRLESSAYEEAKQLTRNRLCARVRLNGPKLDDVDSYLERRMQWSCPTQRKMCSKVLADGAKGRGGWNYVANVARTAMQFAEKGQPVDRDTFLEAQRMVDGTR